MNAFELLKTDHEKVAGILEKIDETTERALKTREELFTQLKNDWYLHAEIEEQIFYPAIEEAKKLARSRSRPTRTQPCETTSRRIGD